MAKFFVTDLFIRRIILLLPNNVKSRRGALLSALADAFHLRQITQNLMTMVSRKIMNYYLNWITNSIQFMILRWIFKMTDSCCWLNSAEDYSQCETLFLIMYFLFSTILILTLNAQNLHPSWPTARHLRTARSGNSSDQNSTRESWMDGLSDYEKMVYQNFALRWRSF